MTDTEHPHWPLRLSLSSDDSPSVEFFGKPLEMMLRPGPTLEWYHGTEETARITALPKTFQHLTFLPDLGERPLLLFPRPQLLCPGHLTLRLDMALPLHLKLAITTDEGELLVTRWSSPTTSRGAYGPVDQAVVCTSCRCPTAATADELASRYHDHPVLTGSLQRIDGDPDPPLPLWARLHLEVVNTTAEPLEVGKIMVPTSALTLYTRTDTPAVATNALTLRLVGPQEAELRSASRPHGPGQYSPLDAPPRSAALDNKALLFLHNYKSKTGLEHGF